MTRQWEVDFLMPEERKMILRMLAEGKITAEEAEQLLDALDMSTAFQTETNTASAATGFATGPAEEAVEEAVSEKTSKRHDADLDVDALAETIRNAVADGLKGMKEGLSAGLGVLNDGVLRGLHEGLRGGLRGLAAARRAGEQAGERFGHWPFEFGFFIGGGPSRQIDVVETADAAGIETVAIATASGDVRVQAWDQPVIKVRARGGVRGRTEDEAERKARNTAIGWRREGTRLVVFIAIGGEEPDGSWASSVDYDVYIPSACGVDLNSKSGDIVLTGITGAIVAQSMSGDIRATGIGSATVDVKTISGDIDVQGGARDGGEFIARSVSGDIDMGLDGMAGGAYELATTSGDIVVVLGGKPDLRATLSTASGDLRVDLEGVRIARQSRWQVTAEAGDGRAKLTAKTMSGDIALQGR